MLKVGLTGGIGSGKSTVARFFEVLGVDVYYADIKAKFLMNNNPELIKLIIENIGDVYDNGVLNKKKLARIIFSDKRKLEFVNSIVHPFVFKDFEEWTQQRKHKKILVQEAAILFESGAYRMMDKVITVYAPEKIRIKRVIKRDKLAEKEVLDRMTKQMNDEEKIKLSDFVVKNYDNFMIIPQILDIYKKLTNYS